MRGLREALWSNVFTHDVRAYEKVLWPHMEAFSTLLLGETGTGKGSASAAIGCSGHIPFDLRCWRIVSSFTDAFIATNLSQFPEALTESERFGHLKGAFTGAVDDVSESVQLKLLLVCKNVFSHRSAVIANNGSRGVSSPSRRWAGVESKRSRRRP